MTSLHVLFVDDEQAILDGLRNSLRKERKRWDMTFALGGQQALEEMKKTPADVVITDMRMPGMDGAELLRQIQRDFPAAARIVLSGQAERESIMRALPVTHQFLHKPCDGETLRAVIEQTHALHKLMQNPALTALVGKLERIPAVPSTYTELARLAADPKADSAMFAKVIEMDAAVCAKVLQLVNSAYFGLGQKIVSIRPGRDLSRCRDHQVAGAREHFVLRQGHQRSQRLLARPPAASLDADGRARQEDRGAIRRWPMRPSRPACCTTSARWCCCTPRRPTTCGRSIGRK